MNRADGALDLFVYGTLKRGFPAHRRFCSAAVYLGAASTAGTLWLHPRGYPVLVVPTSAIRANASHDPAQDARRAVHARATAAPAAGGWRRIRGEVLRFHRPRRDLPPIDEYEGPDEGSAPTYRRVLVALASPVVRVAWTFAAACPQDVGAFVPHPADTWP